MDQHDLRALGYSLVPGSLDKRPLVPWGQWRDRPQTDEEFNSLGHGSLWAIVTGRAHGIVVLDFDGAAGVELATELGLSPNVITGSGGWHVWVLPPSYPVKTCAGVRPGLDVRGEGGLVWTAGRSRKGEYRLIHTGLTSATGIAGLLPERAVEAASAADFGEWEGEGLGEEHAIRILLKECERVRAAEPGTSNSVFNRAVVTVAGLAAAGQLDPSYVQNELLDAAADRGVGTPEAVFASAWAAGWAKPWQPEKLPDGWREAGRGQRRTIPEFPAEYTWLLEPEALPLDAFPAQVRDLVQQGAPAASVEPQFIAAATIPALSAALGGYVTTPMPGRPWKVFPSMYVAIVGPPATAKSPALGLALAPVHDAEDTAWRVAGEEGPSHRFIVDDATTESLGPLLAANPRGLLVVTDEISAFFQGHGQYKQGPGRDRQFYLSAWSGERIIVDRVKRKSLYIARPVLSIVGGIQPDVLDSLTYGAQDGMMERFLMVRGDVIAQPWDVPPLPTTVTDAYAGLWNRLRDFGMQEARVVMTPKADRTWAAWYDAFHTVDGPHLGILGNSYGKVRTFMARIAQLLAACDGGDIQPEHVERAWLIVRWLLSQTLHVTRTSAGLSPDEQRLGKAAYRLREWLDKYIEETGKLPTRSVVLQKGPAGTRTARALTEALDVLGVQL